MKYKFLTALCVTSACFGLAHDVNGQDTQTLQAPNQTDNPDLAASSSATQAWLGVVDKGDYKGSWNQASKILKATMSADEWTHYLDTVRKPLGTPSGRQVLDQRTAKDPKGLPAGDYMVMLYNTTFANKPRKELVTLVKEQDGQWRVLTYQIE